MAKGNSSVVGIHLRQARLVAGLSQVVLARRAEVSRLKVVRAEAGDYIPNLEEAVRLARVLGVSLERLTTGRWRPRADLRGIALELNHLGICDLEVADSRVPGAFRTKEEVLAIAIRGDRPEPRVIEAVPVLLALHKFDVRLVMAFADVYEPRGRTRLAWLGDATLAMSKTTQFPFELRDETQLARLARLAKKPSEPDSLGSQATDRLPPIWLRWNITYSGTLQSFLARAAEVWAARKASRNVREAGE